MSDMDAQYIEKEKDWRGESYWKIDCARAADTAREDHRYNCSDNGWSLQMEE